MFVTLKYHNYSSLFHTLIHIFLWEECLQTFIVISSSHMYPLLSQVKAQSLASLVSCSSFEPGVPSQKGVQTLIPKTSHTCKALGFKP